MEPLDDSVACATSPLRGCVIASRALALLACSAAIGLEFFLTPVGAEMAAGMKLNLPVLPKLWLFLAQMHTALQLFAGSVAARIIYHRNLCCLAELKFNLCIALLFLVIICLAVGGFISLSRALSGCLINHMGT